MLRSTAGKIMWFGKATVFLVGLAVILAVVFGVASSALGADGNPFLLGKRNVTSAISTLVNQGHGPALSLKVQEGEPPLMVNRDTRIMHLNADKVDGQDASAFAGATHDHPGEDITSGTVAEARIDEAIARDGEILPAVEANDGSGSGLDADLLDGKDSSDFQPRTSCPNGTLLHEGACIETNKRGTAGFPNAEATCLQTGRRLPTVAELQTFRLRQGHDFNVAEYTSQIWTDANGSTQNQLVMLVDPASGEQRPSSYGAGAAFRCVAPPNVAPLNESWESVAQSDLRNASAAASACAANNYGSYVNCGMATQLRPYGFNQTTDVIYANFVATATRWASATQHANGGSAFQFDTATGKIEPIPRF